MSFEICIGVLRTQYLMAKMNGTRESLKNSIPNSSLELFIIPNAQEYIEPLSLYN